MSILIRMNQIDGDCLVEISNSDTSPKVLKDLVLTEKQTAVLQTKEPDYVNYSNSQEELHNDQSTITKVTTIKKRKPYTYMQGDYQYFKIGEIYGKIAPDDTLESIGRSCYYANKKKAYYEQK